MIKAYENGTTKTLRQWIEELEITTAKYTYSTGNTYDTYKSAVKAERNGFIDIYVKGGYGLLHSDIEQHMDNSFMIMNNDINDAKLVEF